MTWLVTGLFLGFCCSAALGVSLGAVVFDAVERRRLSRAVPEARLLRRGTTP